MCGASAASEKFRKNILTLMPGHASQLANGQAGPAAWSAAAFVLS
jgi:hypothetical protein